MHKSIRFLVVLFLASAVCAGNSGCWVSQLECLKMKNEDGGVKLGFLDSVCLCLWPLPPTAIAFGSVKSVDVKTGEITTEKRGFEMGLILMPMYPTVIFKSGIHDFIRANYTEYRTEASDGTRYCRNAGAGIAATSVIRRKDVVFGITVKEKDEIPVTGLEILFVQKEGENNEPVLKILPDETFLPLNSPQKKEAQKY